MPAATNSPPPNRSLLEQLESYVHDARNERFADGMDSTFGHRIYQSIAEHGSAAVAAWERVLLHTGNRNETGEELLRQIGLVQHPPSHDARLCFLTASLKHSEPRLRDAAGLGLSLLDDPSALPALREAHSSESQRWLRDGIRLVITQLEQTAHERLCDRPSTTSCPTRAQ